MPDFIAQCQHCKKPFILNKPWQKYCSPFCNKAAYYARRLPPTPLDDPLTGPTQVQEAEYERRKTLRPQQEAESASARTAEVIKKMEELEAGKREKTALELYLEGVDLSKPPTE
jgi:hypothetical protein